MSDSQGGAMLPSALAPAVLKRPLRLRSLLALLVLVAVLPLLAFAAAMISLEIDRQREHVASSMRDSAHLLSLAVDREIAIARTVLETLAGAQSLDRRDFRAFYQLAKNATAAIPDSRVLLFDTSGQQLINTVRPYGVLLPNVLLEPPRVIKDPNYPDLASSGFVREVIDSGQPLVSDVFLGNVTRRPTIAIAIPVKRDGNIIYVLDLSFSLERFTALIGEQRLPARWQAVVFDRNGIIVARRPNPEQFVGRRASPSILQLIKQGETGAGVVKTNEGLHFAAAFSRSSANGWVTMTAREQTSVFALVDRPALLLIGGGLALLFFGLGAALYLGRRIAGTVARLADSAGAIQRGEAIELGPSEVHEIEALRQELVLAGVQAREFAQDREARIAAEARQSEAQTAHQLIAENEAKLRASEARWRRASEASGALVYDIDLAGQRQAIVHGLQNLLGYDPTSVPLTSDWWHTLIHPEDLSDHLAELQENLPVSGHWRDTYRVKHADGSWRYVEDTAEIVKDESGRAVRLIGTAIDVTAQVNALAQVRESEQRLKRVIETDTVGVLFFDQSGTIVHANDVFLRTTGYTREEVERRELNWRRLTPPEWIAESERQMEQFAQTGRIGPYEKEYLLADRSRRWMLLAGRDLGDGTIAEYCIDITERKQGEEALQQRNRQLALLARTSQRLLVGGSERELLEAVFSEIAQLIDMEMFCHYRPVGEQRLLCLETHGGIGDQERDLFATIPYGELLCGRVAEWRKTIIVEDLQHSTHPGSDILRGVGATSYAGFALLANGELVGTIAFISRQRTHLRDGDVKMIQTLCDQLATTLERARLQRQLRDGEERLRLAFEGADLGSWDVNVRTGEAVWNRRHAVLQGYDPDRAPASIDGWRERVHPDDLDRVMRAIESAKRERGPFAVEHRFYLADNHELRWTSLYGRFSYDEAGEAVRFSGVSLDITDRKRAEENLRASEEKYRYAFEKVREYAEQLQEADRRKDDFIAMLSHELRNPLAPISSAAQILKTIPTSDPKLHWCQKLIEKQVAQMSRLMEDLLDMSRIPRDKLELRKERVDLHSIIKAAIETSRPLIEERGHQLTVDLPRQKIQLDGDPARLTQVFGNLLNNAAKYSEKNGRIQLDARLEWRGMSEEEVASGAWRLASEEGNRQQAIGNSEKETGLRQSKIENLKFKMEVAVSVVDAGIGIAPEVLPHLFDSFYQAESGKERRYGGLGIGLSLVKGIVDLHGGRVEAKSAGVGKGSEFIVRLPIKEVASDREVAGGELRVESEEGNRQQAIGSSQTEPVQLPALSTHHSSLATSPERKRVVVVDDNKLQAKSLAMLIETMGFETRFALSGAAGLALISEFRPQVALIDIGLPDMKGYAVAERVRGLSHTHGITLIAQTGWGRDEDREQAKLSGFDHHLTKPIDQQLLEQILRREEAS